MRTGERIKQRRIELGYTVDQLAKLLNKNRETISREEKSPPTRKNRCRGTYLFRRILRRIY